MRRALRFAWLASGLGLESSVLSGNVPGPIRAYCSLRGGKRSPQTGQAPVTPGPAWRRSLAAPVVAAWSLGALIIVLSAVGVPLDLATRGGVWYRRESRGLHRFAAGGARRVRRGAAPAR